jgi:dihydroorotate dehydrogenase
LIYRGLGVVGEIKAALLVALERGEVETLTDLVGVDAAAMTAEDWPA